MKILVLNNKYRHVNGEDICVEEQVSLLVKNDHKVELIEFDNSKIGLEYSLIEVGLGVFSNQRAEKKLVELESGSFVPDVAIVHNIYPLIGPSIYQQLKKRNIPIVKVIHNYRWLCPKGNFVRNGNMCQLCISKRLKLSAIKYGCYNNSRRASASLVGSMYAHEKLSSFDLIDKIVFPSRFAKNLYLKHLPINKTKTSVLHNFYNKPEDNNEAGKRLPKRYFLFVGRISEEKGIEDLLEVFDKDIENTLVVAGDGPQLSILKDLYSGRDNIVFLGKLSRIELAGVYKQAIATIIPSKYYEVMPMVVIESFASSTPVIAPKIGAFKEMIVNNKNGWLYENKNDLYNIVNLARKTKKMSEFRKNAEESFQNKYSANKYYKELMRILREIIK